MNPIRQMWSMFEVGLAGIVVMMLLIFFVSIPMCTLGVPDLPHVAGTGSLAPGVTDLPVIVNSYGIYVDANAPRAATIEAEVGNALATRRYKRVVIEADRRTKFGALEPIFRAARAHRVPVVFAGRTESVLDASGR